MTHRNRGGRGRLLGSLGGALRLAMAACYTGTRARIKRDFSGPTDLFRQLRAVAGADLPVRILCAGPVEGVDYTDSCKTERAL